MLSDWELWACANEALVQHGGRALFVAAVRIAELSNQDEPAGVATWRGIALRIEALERRAVGSVH
jgi:hypothetical protein